MFGRYVLLIRNPIYSICWRNRYFRINKCWKGELLFFRGAFVPLQSLLGKFREAFVPRMKQKQIFRAVVCIGLRKNNIFASSNLSDGRKTKFSTYPRPTIVEKQSFQAFRHLDLPLFFWQHKIRGLDLVGFLCFLFSEALIYSDFLFKSRPTPWFGWFFLKKQTKRDDFGE